MCYQWLFHWSLTRGADTPTHWQCAATLHCRGFPHSFPDYQGAHRSQRQLSFYISPSHPVFVHSCIFDIFFHYRSIRIYTHVLLVLFITSSSGASESRHGQIVFRPSCPLGNHSSQIDCPALTAVSNKVFLHLQIRKVQLPTHWATKVPTLVAQ